MCVWEGLEVDFLNKSDLEAMGIGHAFAMGPNSQVTSHAVNSSEVFQVGFGQGTFDGGLIGVRPPPIRGPANMYHVPFPRGAASGNQGFMT
ncbi:hypothetical protein L195_g061079, partial [Trifolium pratense]